MYAFVSPDLPNGISEEMYAIGRPYYACADLALYQQLLSLVVMYWCAQAKGLLAKLIDKLSCLLQILWQFQHGRRLNAAQTYLHGTLNSHCVILALMNKKLDMLECDVSRLCVKTVQKA